MGEQQVHLIKNKQEMKSFIRSLLNDVKSMEYMIEKDWFENDIQRIGAEQEMILINNDTYKPAPIAVEFLEKFQEYKWLESELAKFNLEIGIDPKTFKGDCLSKLDEEITEKMQIIQNDLQQFGASAVITGILPTLRKFDLSLENLTPKTRYKALMEAINNQLLGSNYELNISGIDELITKHDSPMLEACNTSFQVHLQVTPKNFAKLYNIAQVLSAPVISIAANSPLVFGRRLWHETRITMFQQSIDTRSSHKHMRERLARVNFGNQWLKEGILDIFKDDIARFRVLMSSDIEEDSLQKVGEGKVPKLKALQVHNSTIYRWNRPCYGISSNGKPHLRIENRVLPAGPTIIDEVANAAFWLGMMKGFDHIYEDITDHILFAEAQDNFFKAARYGIDCQFSWLNDTKISVVDLVINELIPIARQGLQDQEIDSADIDKYLGIIEERANRHMNGARWQLRAFTNLKENFDRDEALTILTSCMLSHQKRNIPIINWQMPTENDLINYIPMALTVSECMTTELFTVQKEDIIELVGKIMDWRQIRHMPVEDEKGKLVGLVTFSQVLRELLNKDENIDKNLTVGDVMVTNPITATAETSIKDAMKAMRKNKIGCLPIVDDQHVLVGLITETDFLRITGRLLEKLEED